MANSMYKYELVFMITGSRIPYYYIHSHKHHAGTISFELCTSLSYIFAAVTYSAVWSLVSSPVQTSLPPISSEPFLCESSRGTEERLHHTKLVQPSLLHAHGDTPVVSCMAGESYSSEILSGYKRGGVI